MNNNPSFLSKHLVRRDLERDPDHINHMLWKRKLHKKRVARNEINKVRKHYFKEKQGVDTDTKFKDKSPGD